LVSPKVRPRDRHPKPAWVERGHLLRPFHVLKPEWLGEQPSPQQPGQDLNPSLNLLSAPSALSNPPVLVILQCLALTARASTFIRPLRALKLALSSNLSTQLRICLALLTTLHLSKACDNTAPAPGHPPSRP
jgi:hypothetical protein